MTPPPESAGRSPRALELLLEVLEIQPSARTDWLREHAPEPALREEVERLLAREEIAEACFGGPLDPTPEVSELEAERRAEARIGRYRILRRIGGGGMGEVFLAQRQGDYDQRVALKLVRGGRLDAEARRQLERERSLLASLDHPHIARLIDGGTTKGGQPYFVMEHVEGTAIDRYCQERALDVDQRLGLFIEVCRAVESAHRKLVVHRDIKPSNVLVRDDGLPKLLDFGIAKLIDDPADGEPTVTLRRAFTPGYASPEQVAGQPISTSSDVYSLGVLLHRLVTGLMPLSATGGTAGTSVVSNGVLVKPSLRVLTEEPEEPVPPASTSPPQDRDGVSEERRRRDLARRLRGDLDLIVSVALRSEPERRYDSVASLREDLERHLAGLPVRAHPDSAAYRFRLFVGRNRLAVALASAALAAILGGLLVSIQETARTRLERDKALRVSNLLQEILSAPDSSWYAAGDGPDVKVVDVLASASDRLDETDELPEIEGTIRRTLADTYRVLGRYPAALSQAEEAVRLHRRTLAGDDPELARSLHAYGTALLRSDRPEDAEHAFRETDRICERADCSAELITGNQNNLAFAVAWTGRREEATLEFERSLALSERMNGRLHPVTAIVAANLGDLLLDAGKFDEAAQSYELADEIFRGLEPQRFPEEVHLLASLARLESRSGNHARAAERYREAIEAIRALYGPSHPFLVNTHNFLAQNLAEAGELAAARRAAEASVELAEKALGTQHPDFAWARVVLGDVVCRVGERAAGLAVLSEGLGGVLEHLPEDDWRVRRVEAYLGLCRLGAGDPQAVILIERGYRAVVDELGTEDDRARRLRRRIEAAGLSLPIAED